MANGSINLVNLDFDALKASLKSYLSSQTIFKDYDYEGSNINVLLDLLSYNTYINSFYLNMVSSEMFLDSAQLRDSVISHAKQLNYVPRSFRSATAKINLSVRPISNTVTTVSVPRGTSFTSKVGSNTYTFTLQDNIAINGSSNGLFTASNVEIKEGVIISDTFIYNSQNESQRFVLTNPTIDTTTLRVYVTEDNASNVLVYTQANSYLNLTDTSQVFFLQAAENDLYELVFGNGAQGRMPKHGAAVSAVYNVGTGELPNGCATFSVDDAIDGHTNVFITTVSTASGGQVHESLQSIRKNAPRFYATQERAVTANDYKTLLQLAYPEINSIHVYGGENESPPRYGKVVISLDINDADGVSEGRKAVYTSYLKERCPLTIDPVFIDPTYLNLEVISNVKYNLNTSTISARDLTAAVVTQVRIFNQTDLNQFDTTFRYSQLIKQIDKVNEFIISNDTRIVVYKDLSITLNSNNPLTIRFNNALTAGTIHSTFFTYNGTYSLMKDDGSGAINIYYVNDAGDYVSIANIGTVDYATGMFTLSGLNISAYDGSSLKLKATAANSDVDALLNDIIRIKDEDINVSTTGIRV